MSRVYTNPEPEMFCPKPGGTVCLGYVINSLYAVGRFQLQWLRGLWLRGLILRSVEDSEVSGFQFGVLGWGFRVLGLRVLGFRDWGFGFYRV